MIAHIIHDADGTIRSVIFQSPEIEGGELEIQSDDDSDFVTTVTLHDTFPELAVDSGAEPSRHHLYLLARDIRRDFRIDPERSTLERAATPTTVAPTA
jgi:hypothetical protein